MATGYSTYLLPTYYRHNIYRSEKNGRCMIDVEKINKGIFTSGITLSPLRRA